MPTSANTLGSKSPNMWKLLSRYLTSGGIQGLLRLSSSSYTTHTGRPVFLELVRQQGSIFYQNNYIFPPPPPLTIWKSHFPPQRSVIKEMKCGGDSEILHEIVLDNTRKSERHDLIRVVTRTISCIISKFPLHFSF